MVRGTQDVNLALAFLAEPEQWHVLHDEEYGPEPYDAAQHVAIIERLAAPPKPGVIWPWHDHGWKRWVPSGNREWGYQYFLHDAEPHARGAFECCSWWY